MLLSFPLPCHQFPLPLACVLLKFPLFELLFPQEFSGAHRKRKMHQIGLCLVCTSAIGARIRKTRAVPAKLQSTLSQIQLPTSTSALSGVGEGVINLVAAEKPYIQYVPPVEQSQGTYCFAALNQQGFFTHSLTQGALSH